RPCNGKTELAMNIALDFAEAGSSVWYFSMAGNSRGIAEEMGLNLHPLESHELLTDGWFSRRAFRVVNGNRALPLTLIDARLAPGVALPSWRLDFPSLGHQNPKLVIYDGGDIDVTALNRLEQQVMSHDLFKRKLECKRVYGATILMTMGMPSSSDVESEDKRPTFAELQRCFEQRPGRTRVDEIYFVYRPGLYEENCFGGRLNAIELTRCNRIRKETRSRLLVMDEGSGRLRNPNHEEVERVIEEKSASRAARV
ncbi:MAG: hypothetical protein QF790_01000, partial [Gammaproteobacteria bacterium]|nr:hypothetical protein [Gammaproteobacteria bacterium]